MQNRRERRKLLKQFGLLKSQSGKNAIFSNIEDGKEIHRKHMQESVNKQIKKEIELGKKTETDFFVYRNQDNEYGNLQSMLLNKDWDQIEKD
jgi:hypothetical protein